MLTKYSRLTRTEDLAIAQLLAEGMTLKEIAAEMKATVGLLEYRIGKMKTRYNAKSTVHLVSKLIVNFHISPRLSEAENPAQNIPQKL